MILYKAKKGEWPVAGVWISICFITIAIPVVSGASFIGLLPVGLILANALGRIRIGSQFEGVAEEARNFFRIVRAVFWEKRGGLFDVAFIRRWMIILYLYFSVLILGDVFNVQWTHDWLMFVQPLNREFVSIFPPVKGAELFFDQNGMGDRYPLLCHIVVLPIMVGGILSGVYFRKLPLLIPPIKDSNVNDLRVQNRNNIMFWLGMLVLIVVMSAAFLFVPYMLYFSTDLHMDLMAVACSKSQRQCVRGAFLFSSGFTSNSFLLVYIAMPILFFNAFLPVFVQAIRMCLGELTRSISTFR